MHPDIAEFMKYAEREFPFVAALPEMLEEKYGPPAFFHQKDGRIVYEGINESYFAGLNAAHHDELYEPLENVFYRYSAETGLYSEVTIDAIKQEISANLLKIGRDSGVVGMVKERKDRQLTAIVKQLKGIVEQRDAFKKAENFIHLANGVLEVKKDGTVELLPFSSKYRSRNRSPIAYDPQATCPRFLNELILPAVHPEDIAVVQKYMGICLLGRNLVQRFMILDGTPGRGKSQLAIVIQHLVGLVNCTQLRTEHLTGRFELFRFLKKTLLTGVDVPGDFLSTKGAQVLKALVGGDLMNAEQKGEKGCFPIEGTYCVVITSNSRLRVKLEGDADAWRRRLLIVRYETPPVAKKIPDFGQYLIQNEGSGILNWALAGLVDLLRDIAATGDIALTPRQRGIVDALLSESDSLGYYLRERVEKDASGDLTVEEIVTGYLQHCPGKGWVPLPTTLIQRRLEERMLELFQTGKSNSIDRGGVCCRGFRNVRFKT